MRTVKMPNSVYCTHHLLAAQIHGRVLRFGVTRLRAGAKMGDLTDQINLIEK